MGAYIRLLGRSTNGQLELVNFDDNDVPPYAILSHTWTAGQEVTYNELINGMGKDKTGYAKIQFCIDRAGGDGLQYSSVDTCCIDKSDPIELSTAINSMFRWYQRAAKCYVLLSDVTVPTGVSDPKAFTITWIEAFRRSRWFRRGWTLQELLASPAAEFFSKEGKRLGDKIELEREIHETTSIPVAALRGQRLLEFSVEQRMSWMTNRTTTIKEDRVYCLLGIFGVFLPLIYGEGESYATSRLRDEIRRRQHGKGATSSRNFVVSSLLPFPRNELFVGKESQLRSLEQFLYFDGHRRTTIYGLGGCGKSALANEFAYRTLARGGHLVLWVPAISRESFELAYREIGIRLRIPCITEDNADIKLLVKTRLSSEGMGNWLMIVDNADDSEVLLQSASASGSVRLYDYIPHSFNGKVIFTTRNRKAAESLTPNNVIELNDMSRDKDEARQLLKRRISQPALVSDENAVSQLLHDLAYLPLAIVQAAAFMNSNCVLASEYVSLFQEVDSESALFSEHFEDHSRYQEMDSSIAKTWHISFDQIKKQDALAAEYLSFMACISRINIPQSLMPPGNSRIQQLKAIGTLKGYAFIMEQQQQEPESEKFFDMHRLVHLSSAWWLERQQEQTAWIARVAARLEELMPYGGHEGKSTWTAYLSHAIHLARSDGELNNLAKASLLDRVGDCQATVGQYSSAEKTHRRVLLLREEALGENHDQTLTSMNALGVALSNQGNYEAAEAMHMLTLAKRQKVLGDQHYDTLTSMSNLEVTLQFQERWKEAEELGMRVVEMRKRVLGTENPYTLNSMSNLAMTLQNRGQWKEAEELETRVMEMCKRVLGTEHPYTINSITNLASMLNEQGRWTEAEELAVQAMKTSKRVLGPEHPDTLTKINNLALTLENQGRLTEAEELAMQAVKASKRVLGAEHPNTLIIMDNLASMRKAKDKTRRSSS